MKDIANLVTVLESIGLKNQPFIMIGSGIPEEEDSEKIEESLTYDELIAMQI